MERFILHCDLNNFFASVECLSHPEWKNVPMAVCGSIENRHGIVLAKNYVAKEYGIKTGEVVWQARQKCPNLIIAETHYMEYIKYSKMVRRIYEDYTDEIESMGIDECWLDVTHSMLLFESPIKLAYIIKERVKKEIGLTISVGVSFNKTFSKLASDMKKPDAVTVISRKKFKDIVWKLPIEDMIGIGHATSKILFSHGCKTLGDVASCPKEFLIKWLGKNGETIWFAVNGYDNAKVLEWHKQQLPQSVGRGITLPKDVASISEVDSIITELGQEVGYELRSNQLLAKGVSICIRNNQLTFKEYQRQLLYPSQSTREIVAACFELFKEKYDWDNNIRSITIRAIGLVTKNENAQIGIFEDYEKREKILRLENSIDKLKMKYGIHVVNSGVYFKNIDLVKNIQAPHQSFYVK